MFLLDNFCPTMLASSPCWGVHPAGAVSCAYAGSLCQLVRICLCEQKNTYQWLTATDSQLICIFNIFIVIVHNFHNPFHRLVGEIVLEVVQI